jgi:hypothetical protein
MDAVAVDAADPRRVRADLEEVLERQALVLDEARPEAVARRRVTGIAPPGRTSAISATRAPSPNTGRSPSPPNGTAARSTTCCSTRRPTG